MELIPNQIMHATLESKEQNVCSNGLAILSQYWQDML